MLYTTHDVCLLTDTLIRHGIVPLVWGEMACLVAYQSSLVPGRLFFIIQDAHMGRALRIFENIGLRQKTTYQLSENLILPLSRPYPRFLLHNDAKVEGESTPYLQLFSGSDVGCKDLQAWNTSIAVRFQSSYLLVPNEHHFLRICAALYVKFWETRSDYRPWQVSTAMCWLDYLLEEVGVDVCCCRNSRDYESLIDLLGECEDEMASLLTWRLPHRLKDLSTRMTFSGNRSCK